MQNEARSYWLRMMMLVAGPVLASAAARELRKHMPVEGSADRKAYSHLEAVGRTLAGIAPWLDAAVADAEEARLQAQYVDWSQRAMDAVTNPASPDFGGFGNRGRFDQTLVDTAFLAQAIIRAPKSLWLNLPEPIRENVRSALLATRSIRPPYCNWLLFSAMIEAALSLVGEHYDPVRIDYAIRQHELWYKGDGIYGDGPEFHWDYYNSYVIQPMLIDIMRTVGTMYTEAEYAYADLNHRIMKRAGRYAEILERLIAPDGTFPAIGRSIAYRTGAFHLLAQLAWLQELPAGLPPAQVRCALQAVMARCLEEKRNYDANGWLKIGLCAGQPSLGEGYISTGSLYLCSTVFLPLGLSANASFWTGKDCAWSSVKIWSGLDMPADRAL
ncbi:MAG TPA: DUF2264 domain-containing protein [Bacilli bacterium]